MSEKEEFYKLGKMVGLTENEVENVFSKRNMMCIYIIIFILITITLIFIGNSIFHYIDPYAENTYYGTIEPKFHKKIKKKLIRAKII